MAENRRILYIPDIKSPAYLAVRQVVETLFDPAMVEMCSDIVALQNAMQQNPELTVVDTAPLGNAYCSLADLLPAQMHSRIRAVSNPATAVADIARLVSET